MRGALLILLSSVILCGCGSLQVAKDRESIAADISAFYGSPTTERCYQLAERLGNYASYRQLDLLKNAILMDCEKASNMSKTYAELSKKIALRLLNNAAD